ncbi:MAG TPA: sulfatase-like hydrolase/transferase, partial [Ktedonobacteraceae bacterium]
MSAKRPHIIIFNPDQWRGDVPGYIGNPAAVTPTLDRLAETEAVAFSHAYCQNPVCTPSRCSFLTGWYPHVRGHR